MKTSSHLFFSRYRRLQCLTLRVKTCCLIKLTSSLVFVLLTGGLTTICAQSSLDGFDPNITGNAVYAVAIQPDGKILIGGDFSAVAGVPRNNIARLNQDGTLDTGFNPTADNLVSSIAVQTDGKILIGGRFATLAPNGGASVMRKRIARLNSNGTVDTAFDPNVIAGFTVDSIAVQADAKILVGGSFTTLAPNGGGSVTRNNIARLNSNGTVDTPFDPNAAGEVVSIAIQTDSKILIGGSFTTLAPNGGATVPHHRLARLNSDGTADSGFSASVDSTSSIVYSIAIQADCRILIGGTFFQVNGQARNRIARLNSDGSLDTAFDPNVTATKFIVSVYSIALQTNGKILIGGAFTTLSPNGGGAISRHRIARLNLDGTVDAGFDPNVENVQSDHWIAAMAIQPDGKIVVGGQFTTISGQTRNRVARLEIDGRADRTLLDLNINGTVSAIAVQPDRKVLIGGNFSSVLGVTRNNIARLNTDGTLDMGFNPNVLEPLINSIAVLADGRILVGGGFVTVNNQSHPFIARLDSVTGLPDSFNPQPNFTVNVIASHPNGKIVVGGNFTNIGGQSRNFIALLDPSTGMAAAFNPNPNDRVRSIAVQRDGKILAGGNFTSLAPGGTPVTRNHIARLIANGSADTNFDPNANNVVFGIALQPDGKVLAGGVFTNVGGQTRNRIARLAADLGAPDSFNPNANSTVDSMAVQANGEILGAGEFISFGGLIRNHIARFDAVIGTPDSFDPNSNNTASIALASDGKILAGGSFTSIGGVTRSHFARLVNDAAAFQNLVVTQNSINWLRGGSSPQFTRVTFEFSTDDVNYSLLGNADTSGSTWILTDLDLPIGQNFFIRARGYYRSGSDNASESISESVRNAFIKPLQFTGAVSRKVHGSAGTFDIPLPLSGAPGVECRRSATGSYTLVFTFGSTVVSGNASLTSGIGSVSGSPTFSGNTMTTQLTGVTDVQKITVTLSNVTSSIAEVLPTTAININMLIGDTNGNKAVNATDLTQTKLRTGSPVNIDTFRNDVTATGIISAADVTLVKSSSGHGLP
jgi:uncharacterized delta-60 repeat protein